MNYKDFSQLERSLKNNEYIVIEKNKVFVINRNSKGKKFIGNLTIGISSIDVDNNSELFKSTSFSGLISLNEIPDDYEKPERKIIRKPRRKTKMNEKQLMDAAFADYSREKSIEILNKKQKKQKRPKAVLTDFSIIPDPPKKSGYNYMPTEIRLRIKKIKDAEGDFSI